MTAGTCWKVATAVLATASYQLALTPLLAQQREENAAPRQLRLEAMPARQRYCEGDVVTGILQLTCALRFTNNQPGPIGLSRMAGSVLRIQAAGTRARLEAANPEFDLSITNLVEGPPPAVDAAFRKYFVTLPVGGTFRVEQMVPIPVCPDQQYPRGCLAAGDYYVRLTVSTAPTLKSNDLQGLLWRHGAVEDVWRTPAVSDPFPVRVSQKPRWRNCN
jgi:hypothetical protein